MATQPVVGPAEPIILPRLIERYRAADGVTIDVDRLRSADLPTRRQVVIDAARTLREQRGQDARRAVSATLDALDGGEQTSCTHCGEEGVAITVVATSGELGDPEGTGCHACDSDGEPWLCDSCLRLAGNGQLDAGVHDRRL